MRMSHTFAFLYNCCSFLQRSYYNRENNAWTHRNPFFFIPSTQLCDTGGTGWCRGRLDMGKSNVNEIPILNHRQVVISACISMVMHTPTPTNWAQKVLFGIPHPQNIAAVFSPDFRFFCLKDGFEIQSLIWKSGQELIRWKQQPPH